MTLLDALDAHGLTERIIIVRLADHGELGLSHGMREKSYSAYEEMIRVPFVVSNPILFPEPLATDPLQLKNLPYGSPNAEIRMGRLHNALTQKLVDAGDLPTSFPWPTAPASPAPLGKPSAAPRRP